MIRANKELDLLRSYRRLMRGEKGRSGLLHHFLTPAAVCLLVCVLIWGVLLLRNSSLRRRTDDVNDWLRDPAVVEQGRVIIGYLAPCYILFSATEVLSSMMRGVGNAVKPTIITLFGACVLRLILLFTMTFPHLSNLTIALCYPITWTVASAMFLIYYKFGHWLPAYPQKRVEIG